MSLTSFLERKDVRDRFRQEFAMPGMKVKRELLAPPLSNRYSLVGTAFDYLARFYVKRLNPHAITRRWIAEQVLLDLSWMPIWRQNSQSDTTVYGFSWTPQEDYIKDKRGTILRLSELEKKVRQIVERARVDYADYLSSGRITDELVESALRLAQIDPIFRLGVVDKNLGDVHKEDMDDLLKLISLIDSQFFKAYCLCLLNPTFGEASSLVGGADADLVIDNAIIDIKTTKNFRLDREDFNQLIGYFVLHEIAGFGNLAPR
ncbi:MAG: hypothetical protein J7455_19850, partial [Roseiflexus sp.]|nr:hypothetical protein [Roseiflexus sp.]